MHNESNIIFALRPMTMKPLNSGTSLFFPEYYLDPVQVQKVAPDLVINESGELLVRYDEINVMLLNEFLQAKRLQRAHQQIIEALTTQAQGLADEVKSLQGDIDDLKKSMEDLKSRQDAVDKGAQAAPTP